MKNRKWIKLLLVILALVVLGVVFTCSFNENSGEGETEGVLISDNGLESPIVETVQTEIKETAVMADELLCVHVCGEVVNPNVYYLKEGARIHEAISLAGGLTDDADANYINMAETITDGEQIYIPSKEEVKSGTFSANAIQKDTDDRLVNINEADVSGFMTLPGIGQVKAEAIVAYRKENGRFNSIDELKNVSGIGDSLFEEIKGKIKV